jgi:hypothetical protein
MNGLDCLSFIIRILAFFTTYYFMIDYLFICNVNTKIGSTIVIVGIITISLVYYPLRGKHLKICTKCNRRGTIQK